MALQTRNKEEVFEAIDEFNVRFVRIWFTDILGIPKSFHASSVKTTIPP